jgi:nitrile hydratase accessory protein
VNESIAQLLAAVSTIPRDRAEPVFRAPWEAQAFATAVHLHAQGVFSWLERADYLAAEIKNARQRGDLDSGEIYYCHWLTALEQLVVAKELTTEHALRERHAA